LGKWAEAQESDGDIKVNKGISSDVTGKGLVLPIERTNFSPLKSWN